MLDLKMPHTIPVKTAAYHIRRLNEHDRAEAFEELIEFVTGKDIDVSHISE